MRQCCVLGHISSPKNASFAGGNQALPVPSRQKEKKAHPLAQGQAPLTLNALDGGSLPPSQGYPQPTAFEALSLTLSIACPPPPTLQVRQLLGLYSPAKSLIHCGLGQ